jgi:hypothetical protein
VERIGVFRSAARVHGAYAIPGGTISCRDDVSAGRAGRSGQNRQTKGGQNGFSRDAEMGRGMASLIAGVMLHLR